MAAYHRVDDLQSPAGWLPVRRDQLGGPTLGNEYGKPLPFFTTVMQRVGHCTIYSQEAAVVQIYLWASSTSFWTVVKLPLIQTVWEIRRGQWVLWAAGRRCTYRSPVHRVHAVAYHESVSRPSTHHSPWRAPRQTFTTHATTTLNFTIFYDDIFRECRLISKPDTCNTILRKCALKPRVS